MNSLAVAPRLASLSIDLDALAHYHRIHGLDEPRLAEDPVYLKGAERFGELCARLGVKGTVFCVGQYLKEEGAARAVRLLAEGGHEIANHSLSHDYALSRHPPQAILAEIRGGAEAVTQVAGRRPVGFRAPGYTLSSQLLAVLLAEGYRYDASAFPAAPYYLAKAAVLFARRLVGRPSAAILDRPRVLFAPRVPYRPHVREPYAKGEAELIELPVATGLFALPLTGAFISLAPRQAVRLVARALLSRPLLDLELHGLDLLDRTEVPPALPAFQPELRVPLELRLSRLAAFVGDHRDRSWVPLAEAADELRVTA
ncbi:MAG TPA: polysaccharide deacetylase family protein [Anaeromyxobacteraceae bacterium]|nr:polysaccharide deacetylase family protein [Anaeromyxobacteraceae bacterium]